jgi:pimeloyl-ACP methyl ester carboxylesterase
LSEREWLELVIPAMFGERYRSEEPSRVQNLARWWARHPPNAFGLEQQGIAYDCFDCSERLAQLKKPVLLLYGTEDRLSPPANAMFLLQNLPDARLVWLEQVGHSPNAEASERFHAEIEHFTE